MVHSAACLVSSWCLYMRQSPERETLARKKYRGRVLAEVVEAEHVVLWEGERERCC